MDERAKAALEDRRQIEHLVPLAFAFTLPYLPYWAIVGLALLAVVHALIFSPRLIRVTTRSDEAEKGFSPGKLYYALSVLALVLVFHDRLYIAAGVWAILSTGDSLSNLLGRRLKGLKIPYQRSKTWAGFLSFWVFGGLACWGLMLWNAPPDLEHSAEVLLLFSAVAALFCAFGESLPAVIDDNLAVPWIGALTLWALFLIPDASPKAAAPWLHALAANLAAVAAVRLFGWLSWRGALLASLFGMIIYGSLGLIGFLTMTLFLVVASAATQAGLSRKSRLGVAQANQGARGVSNILSNGCVALALAIFSFWIDDPLLAVAYCAAVATAGFDTVSTEIGQWLGRQPYSPIRFRAVPVGTPGAVSAPGTLAGMGSGLLIAALPALTGWLPAKAALCVWLGALSGNVFESVLAAWHDYDFAFSDEALNLHSTLFGAAAAGFLWSAIS